MGSYRIPLWPFVVALVFLACCSAPLFSENEARQCPRCNAVVAEKLAVVVTDFATDKDLTYCNVACAVRDMADRYPTSRAIAHDPFAGKEVRVIRAGAQWVTAPTSAVFLYLPDAQDLEPARRCQAFPRQDEYIQYLATHPEVAAHTPRPLRLKELLAAFKEADKDTQRKAKSDQSMP